MTRRRRRKFVNLSSPCQRLLRILVRFFYSRRMNNIWVIFFQDLPSVHLKFMSIRICPIPLIFVSQNLLRWLVCTFFVCLSAKISNNRSLLSAGKVLHAVSLSKFWILRRSPQHPLPVSRLQNCLRWPVVWGCLHNVRVHVNFQHKRPPYVTCYRATSRNQKAVGEGGRGTVLWLLYLNVPVVRCMAA